MLTPIIETQDYRLAMENFDKETDNSNFPQLLFSTREWHMARERRLFVWQSGRGLTRSVTGERAGSHVVGKWVKCKERGEGRWCARW